MRRADYPDGAGAWKAYDSPRESEPVEQAAAALLAVAEVWLKRLSMHNNEHALAQAEDARRMCEILGVDYAALEDEASKAIPEPKYWMSACNDASTTDLPDPEAADMKPPWVEDEEEVSTTAAPIG